MKTQDFDFNLPQYLIAQHPSDKRDHSRLMIVDKYTGEIKHRHFYDIIDEFEANDTLVMNNTRVMPARLIGEKEDTGAVIEVLLLKSLENDLWETLTKPAKRIKKGSVISFGNGKLKLVCTDIKNDGIRIYQAHYEGIFLEILETLGSMPLPPYITERLENPERYQTVYAKISGSAAAPTAGLHFTQELLSKLKAKGVEIIEITLHVGLGTFRPVAVDDINKHQMHHEDYYLDQVAATKLNRAHLNKRRIIAVGTTTVRTLESNFDGQFHAGKFDTNIFIYPGYVFKIVDVMMTNFHLPKSTLVMLVSAFSGTSCIKKAYQEAIDKQYRFFSFGDAMLLK